MARTCTLSSSGVDWIFARCHRCSWVILAAQKLFSSQHISTSSLSAYSSCSLSINLKNTFECLACLERVHVCQWALATQTKILTTDTTTGIPICADKGQLTLQGHPRPALIASRSVRAIQRDLSPPSGSSAFPSCHLPLDDKTWK